MVIFTSGRSTAVVPRLREELLEEGWGFSFILLSGSSRKYVGVFFLEVCFYLSAVF